MGRLFDALRLKTEPGSVANPANVANLQSASIERFADSQDSQRSGNTEITAHLLALAAAEELPAELVTGMQAEDLAAWAWFADQPDGTRDTLSACLHTLARSMHMEGET